MSQTGQIPLLFQACKCSIYSVLATGTASVPPNSMAFLALFPFVLCVTVLLNSYSVASTAVEQGSENLAPDLFLCGL